MNPLPYLRQGRHAVHVGTTAIMAGIGIRILWAGDTLHSSRSYGWFLRHWPYTERNWGLAFVAFALLGLLGILARNRYAQLASATAIGAGHLLIAQGIWAANNVSTGPITYSIIAALSVWVFWRVVEEEA